MVYLKNWSEYEAAATELYKQSPTKVRYCVKFRPKEGKLVLKVTDDIKCIKYKTHSSIILNRFETLNLRLLTLMAAPSASSLPPPTSDTPATSDVPGQTDKDGDIVMTDAGTGAEGKGKTGAAGGGPGAGASGGGGVGKKKKKGKK